MTNTRRYYEAIRDFRETMKEYQKEAQDKLGRIEQYKGSKGYDENRKKIEEERMQKVRALQHETWIKISAALGDMRKALENKKMVAPTPEQEATLRTLQMREKLTLDEIHEAENMMRGCPLALSVVHEMARKQGFVHFAARAMSSDGGFKGLKNMEATARDICRLTEVGNRSKWLKGDYFERQPGLFRVDVDFTDEWDCIGSASFCNDEVKEEFLAAVNGTD